MTIRDYAKSVGFEVVGELKRIKDNYYGIGNNHYPVWIDDAGNKYCKYCITTKDGKVI